jgi:hypothetical protein
LLACLTTETKKNYFVIRHFSIDLTWRRKQENAFYFSSSYVAVFSFENIMPWEN